MRKHGSLSLTSGSCDGKFPIAKERKETGGEKRGKNKKPPSIRFDPIPEMTRPLNDAS